MRQTFFCSVAFALCSARLEIGRGGWPWRTPVQIGFSVSIHDAEIVLRMLIEILGRYPISACSRLTGQRHVAFKHLVRIATYFYVRTVAVKSLDPVRHSRTMVRVVPIVAAARAFVWSWSHDTCLIAVDIIGPCPAGAFP